MSEPFDIENERIEITDDDGNSTVYRPMAIVGAGEEVYYVFGAVSDDEAEQRRQLRLMFVRREEDENGVSSYVICENEKELEQIVASCIRQVIAQAIRSKRQREKETPADTPCNMTHGPGEFCFCGKKEYIQ